MPFISGILAKSDGQSLCLVFSTPTEILRNNKKMLSALLFASSIVGVLSQDLGALTPEEIALIQANRDGGRRRQVGPSIVRFPPPSQKTTFVYRRVFYFVPCAQLQCCAVHPARDPVY